MAVNLKLVLAEALSELKKSEGKELATDRDLEKMSKGSSKNHDWPLIKRQYSAVYDNYIRALELLNYCRRTAMDHSDQEMITFCADRMKIYMERCEKLRTKESNVLTSVRDADNSALEDSYLKEGYTWGEFFFVHQRTSAIKGNTPIEYQHTLSDGAYYLQVKNYDDYAVAAPEIKVQISVKGRDGRGIKQQKIIPAMTAWGKNIGVVSSSDVMLRVVSNGMVRTSQVEVTLRQLVPPPETEELKERLSSAHLDTSWVDSLPPLPGAAPVAGAGSAGAGGPLPPPNMDMPELPPPDMNNFGFGLVMPESGPGQHPEGQAQHPQQQQPFPGGYADPNMMMQQGGMAPHPPGGAEGYPHQAPHPQDGGVMPAPGPLGGEPVYPTSPDSTELLGNLAIPGGQVGSPVETGRDPSSTSSGGMDALADLQVPYNANRASNTGVNGKAAGPTPYFGNPIYPVPAPSEPAATAGGQPVVGQLAGPVPPAMTPEGYPVYGVPPPVYGSSEASSSTRPRPPKLEVQPQVQAKGATAEERLARVQQFMDHYLASSAGDKAMAQAMTNPDKYLTHLQSCNPETRELAERITKLPEPTELGMDGLDDVEIGDMELDLADLEAGNF